MALMPSRTPIDVVLHLTNVQPSQSGAYVLVVSNAFGTAISSPAMLIIGVPQGGDKLRRS